MKAWKTPSKTPGNLGFQGFAGGQGRSRIKAGAGCRRRGHRGGPGPGRQWAGGGYPDRAGRKPLDAMVNVPARRQGQAPDEPATAGRWLTGT